MNNGVFTDLTRYEENLKEIKRLQSLPNPEVTFFKSETKKSNWFSQLPLDENKTQKRLRRKKR